jgi:hypothetical protein
LWKNSRTCGRRRACAIAAMRRRKLPWNPCARAAMACTKGFAPVVFATGHAGRSPCGALRHVGGPDDHAAVLGHGLGVHAQPPCNLVDRRAAAQLAQREGVPQLERAAFHGLEPRVFQHRLGRLVVRLLAPRLAAERRGKEMLAGDARLRAHLQPMLEQLARPRRYRRLARGQVAVARHHHLPRPVAHAAARRDGRQHVQRTHVAGPEPAAQLQGHGRAVAQLLPGEGAVRVAPVAGEPGPGPRFRKESDQPAGLAHGEELGQRIGLRRLGVADLGMGGQPVGGRGVRRHAALRRVMANDPVDEPQQAQRMAGRKRLVGRLHAVARGLEGLEVARVERVEVDHRQLAVAPRGKAAPHVAVDRHRPALPQRTRGALVRQPTVECEAMGIVGGCGEEGQRVHRNSLTDWRVREACAVQRACGNGSAPQGQVARTALCAGLTGGRT